MNKGHFQNWPRMRKTMLKNSRGLLDQNSSRDSWVQAKNLGQCHLRNIWTEPPPHHVLGNANTPSLSWAQNHTNRRLLPSMKAQWDTISCYLSLLRPSTTISALLSKSNENAGRGWIKPKLVAQTCQCPLENFSLPRCLFYSGNSSL